eukprot:15020-Heterococcus_DN1.PRE.4
MRAQCPGSMRCDRCCDKRILTQLCIAAVPAASPAVTQALGAVQRQQWLLASSSLRATVQSPHLSRASVSRTACSTCAARCVVPAAVTAVTSHAAA